MPISTTDLNEARHKMWCASLGVDDFKVDYFDSVHRDEVLELRETSWTMFRRSERAKKKAHPPVIYWKREGVWYSAVVPVEVRTEEWSCLFAGGTYDVVDWEKMSKAAIKIIAEA